MTRAEHLERADDLLDRADSMLDSILETPLAHREAVFYTPVAAMATLATAHLNRAGSLL